MKRYRFSHNSPRTFLTIPRSDPADELLMIIWIFTHFFALETTLTEHQFFRVLAVLVGRREAQLSARGIVTIVSKMGYLEEGCSVGADGSLYNVCSGSMAFLTRLMTLTLSEISQICGSRARRPRRYFRRQGTVGGVFPIFLFCYSYSSQEHCYPSCRGWKWRWKRHHCW